MMTLLLSLLLFVGACVGHTALMVACHNWWYGLALPKHTGKLVHLFFGLATVAGWAALWLWCGPDLVAWLQQPGQGHVRHHH
jgi:hypothetical protein